MNGPDRSRTCDSWDQNPARRLQRAAAGLTTPKRARFGVAANSSELQLAETSRYSRPYSITLCDEATSSPQQGRYRQACSSLELSSTPRQDQVAPISPFASANSTSCVREHCRGLRECSGVTPERRCLADCGRGGLRRSVVLAVARPAGPVFGEVPCRCGGRSTVEPNGKTGADRSWLNPTRCLARQRNRHVFRLAVPKSVP
jgi:hypothetical protein